MKMHKTSSFHGSDVHPESESEEGAEKESEI